MTVLDACCTLYGFYLEVVQKGLVKVNTKKVRELSGLTQEQIARAFDLTLNGWQRKEQHNTKIKVELKITEERIAQLLQAAHQKKMSVSDLVSEMIRETTSKK